MLAKASQNLKVIIRISGLLGMARLSTLSPFVVGTLYIGGAHAQVLLHEEGGNFKIENRSAADLLDVSRGLRSIGRLASGETWEADEAQATDLTGNVLPLKVDGRIKLAHWGDALNQLPGNGLWARLHLETVGLDVNRGFSMASLVGARQLADNITHLRQATAEMTESWLKAGPLNPLKAGLLAYAARYVPAELLLTPLLEQIKPITEFKDGEGVTSNDEVTWPEGYELLPSPRSALRQAIELQGTQGLRAALVNEAWSKDRGFSDIQLAFALLSESEVMEILKQRGDEREANHFMKRFNEEATLCSEKGPLAAEALIRKMIKARELGDLGGAISHATSAALMWHRHNMIPEPGQTTKIVCSYVDMGAQKSINEKQLIAAQAYLTLGQRVCFGHPFYRSRAAEYMRTRGDLSFFDLDLEGAIHWYRGAVSMSDELIDRVRLIDTLARLSIIEITQGNTTLAKDYLKEARRQETPQVPPREMLLIAEDLMPIPDERARIGMMIMIVILGIGALSQILKVIFGRKKK